MFFNDLGNNQNKASMVTVVSKALPPGVKATISTNSWNLTTETKGNSNINVIEGSLLLMICLANYPVAWFHDKIMVDQKRTYNPSFETKKEFMENDRQFVEDDNYHATPIQQYQSIMTFENINATRNGLYICCESISRSPLLTTAIQIDIQNRRDLRNEEPEILQMGFKKIRQEINSEIFNTSFVYTMTNAIEIKQYVVTPDMITRLMLVWNESGIYYEETETDEMDRFDPTMFVDFDERSKLQIGSTSLHWISIGFPGDYDIVLETRLRDGSLSKRNISFEFDTFENDKHDLAVSNCYGLFSESCRYDVYFPLGGLREIEIMFTHTRINEAICNFDDDSFGDENRTIFTFKQANDLYGIRGFSLSPVIPTEEEQGLSYLLHGGYRFFIEVQKPCHLELVITEIIQFSYTERTTKWGFMIVPVDEHIFGSNIHKAVLQPIPSNAKSNAIRYRNDTLTLRCLVPSNGAQTFKDKDVQIVWCKNNIQDDSCVYIRDKTFLNDENISDANNSTSYADKFSVSDPDLVFSASNLANYTRAYYINFTSLAVKHSGSYFCYPSTNEFLLSADDNMKFTSEPFNVKVEAQMPPTFSDHQMFATEKRSLKKGTKQTLVCQVNGNPPPTIIWSKKDGNQIFEILLLPKNETAMDIDQPGLYMCNATNKFGENGRAYDVKNEPAISSPASPLPYAIGIPAAAVIILSLIGLLVWWLKRRALDVSIRNLQDQLGNQRDVHS